MPGSLARSGLERCSIYLAVPATYVGYRADWAQVVLSTASKATKYWVLVVRITRSAKGVLAEWILNLRPLMREQQHETRTI
jgi:hypothetical protein